MGCDIHIFAESKKNGKWIKNEEDVFGPDWQGRYAKDPFDWRSYGMFGFFADVRNYSNSPVLGPIKGLPDDSEYLNEKLENPMSFDYGYFDNGVATTRKESIFKDADYHNETFYTLKELLDFNYDVPFENLRYTEVTRLPGGGVCSNGAAIAKPGSGTITTMREFLGDGFFNELECLKKLGAPEDVRIVFWFDN